ncbi:MAG: HTH domain-containing protein [Planctomycetota bacterium]|nr:HTH domain-containing protein [Planctomycetota bacterium]
MSRRIASHSDGRSIRIIKCLRLLESACYTVDALAAHFRVSRRTVYRDLRLLAGADVPLVSQGRRSVGGTTIRAYHVPAAGPPTAGL